jgi:hypothetical protein
MSKFFVPTNTPEDWKHLLAEPEKHWKTGYSAKSLACCWQEANDFPTCVTKVFKNSGLKLFENVKLLVAFPEYKVPLPGGRRASQSDIFILAKGKNELISMTVEGKVSEGFGQTIDEWIAQESKGKEVRLNFLTELLGLERDKIGDIRYQLIHRTASAVIEAKEFTANSAVMLVHSFGHGNEGFQDYCRFLELFDATGKVDSLVTGRKVAGINLYFAWAKSTISSWQKPPHLQCYNCTEDTGSSVTA